MIPYYERPGVVIYNADCRVVMAEMEPASIDAIVCDPPYGLSFMGKGWDHGVPGVPFWIEAFPVLKPGGHLLAFGGSRTFHRLTCAIEDAGFEIRDCLSWLYGSGFPKSLDVSKAIDKAAGAEREVVGPNRYEGRNPRASHDRQGTVFADDAYVRPADPPLTAPATEAAKQWAGWGTALKPAWEPIIMARKPLQGTVAENVQRYGTGAINVEGCRIATADDLSGGSYGGVFSGSRNPDGSLCKAIGSGDKGRWPANVCLDEDAAALLDQQSGERPSAGRYLKPENGKARGEFEATSWNMPWAEYDNRFAGDTGGASRFMYTAKASRRERGEGNTHPTVKPLALMRWLVTMVTPPDGCVLDPFMGSGTTLLAAKGFHAIGIELDESYCAIAASRLGRETVGQAGLFDS